jgi:hypothetical protein
MSAPGETEDLLVRSRAALLDGEDDLAVAFGSVEVGERPRQTWDDRFAAATQAGDRSTARVAVVTRDRTRTSILARTDSA